MLNIISRIICRILGHNWGIFEDDKFYPSCTRDCRRCGAHNTIDFKLKLNIVCDSRWDLIKEKPWNGWENKDDCIRK